MYTLHIANKNYSSWSLRPWLLMKELNIPFEEKIHAFGDSNFSSFSPTAKVPCLYDNKNVIWDSLAIIEYLAEHDSAVWPIKQEARAWARCAAAEMHSGFSALRNVCGMNVGLKVKLYEIPPQLSNDIARISELWQQGIGKFGGPFLAGNKFTAVDAFFAPIVFRFQTYQWPFSEENKAYCQLILSLPSMKLWQEQALKETWRDASHEDEVLQYGSVLADNRLK